MKHLLAIPLLALTIIACQKDSLNKLDGINYPTETQTFDVNNNGVADFELKFSQVTTKDGPMSESVIFGKLIPLQATLILPHIGGKTFKLAAGDTIKRPGEVISLVYYDRTVVSRNWEDNRWDEEWTIDAEQPDTYYIGYQLDDGSVNDLGYTKFTIDPKDATVKIILTEHTASDLVIIE